MLYFTNTPWWVKKWLYPDYLWSMPRNEKKIYLSFDDGPHPVATPFVLDILKRYKATATFFCIGKNVFDYPDIYKRIMEEGHSVGNHTFHHLNGWKMKNKTYMDNILHASVFINSLLFRPPYGRITRSQASILMQMGFEIVMWSVLSADFDTSITPQKCWSNVRKSVGNGSIIVFHDSEKAMDRMTYALTNTLDHFTHKGFVFEKIEY